MKLVCLISLIIISNLTIKANADEFSNVTLLGKYDEDKVISDIKIHDNYAYVASGTNGLVIIDISNPASPQEIGSYDTGSSADGVFVSGNYAYVADRFDGMRIINITTPTTPVEAGYYYQTTVTSDVWVDGDLAYLAADQGGLKIVNISDPSTPYEVGSFDTLGNCSAVVISNNYAYIADSSSGLRIINISDPANPSETSYFDNYSLYDVEVVGDIAYLACGSNGLRLVNVSNKFNPLEVGSYSTTEFIEKLSISGTYAFIDVGANGLKVINIASPSTPSLVGYYNPSSGSGHTIRADNNTIYFGNFLPHQLMIFEFDAGAALTPTPSPTPVSPPIYTNAVLPSSQVAGKSVNAIVVGQNFLSKPEVRLKSAFNSDITASNVVVKSPTLLTCLFNLSYAAKGLYDVFVDRGDSQDTLPKAFSVLEANQGQLAWGSTSPGECGVPSIAEGKKGISISDPDYDGTNDVYVTNRNTNFYKWTWQNSLWSKTVLPSSPGSVIFNDITAADLDKDDISELYAAGQDNHVYCYQGLNWNQADIGTAADKMIALAKGDGRVRGRCQFVSLSSFCLMYSSPHFTNS